MHNNDPYTQPTQPLPTSHRHPAARPPTQPTMQLTDPPPRRSRTRWVLAGIAAALAVAGITTAIALAAGDSDSEEPYRPIFDQDAIAEATAETEIETAVDRCLSTTRGVEVGDSGHTLTIDGAGLYGRPHYMEVECVLTELGAPDSVLAQMGATRALDGMVSGEWGDYHAVWTYHPDNGVWIVISGS